MKHVRQLFTYPKIRACFGIHKIIVVWVCFNTAICKVAEPKTPTIFHYSYHISQMSLATFFSTNPKTKKTSKILNTWSKQGGKNDLKPTTFIHLCKWSSNTNNKSIIFFKQKIPQSENPTKKKLKILAMILDKP
jgi:hypothetical protein